MRGLAGAAELDRQRIEDLIGAAQSFAREETRGGHQGAVAGLLFFEESLRTRIGFEAAAGRLGAATTIVDGLRQSRQMGAPESFEDTVRCIAPYCDVLCLRHPQADAVARAQDIVAKPVLNCGNGQDEHPVQALIDLLAIHDLRGGIDGTRIAMVGDLAHMRVAHSLLIALGYFENVYVRAIAPPGLEPQQHYTQALRAAGSVLEYREDLELGEVEIVYVAGLPRTSSNGVTIEQQDRYRLDLDTVERLDAKVSVLCPLPRVDEISAQVDGSPRAAYFRQSALGLWMRMALLVEALT